jgi:quinol-cytochrome oxidoreductase complex cytochrome b subunit
MPCSILSEVTATIVGYSLNSITIVSFDFFETFLIPGLGLTDETISRVFFIHLIAPSAIFLIVADHINNLHSTDYTDEDEIEVTYILRREYILEFF